MPDNVKQTIIMRKDLNMRKGKMIAQGAHASIAWLTKSGTNVEQHICDSHAGKLVTYLTPEQLQWIEGAFTKITLGCDSEEQLLALHAQALEAGLTSHLIKDAGKTEFKEPTYTCIAIGPNKAEDIDKITADLTLL